MRHTFDHLFGKEETFWDVALVEATTTRLKELSDMVQAVTKDSDGPLHISARYRDGNIVQEIVLTKGKARHAAAKERACHMALPKGLSC